MTFTTWLSACFQKNQHLLQQLVVLSSLKNCLKLYIYIQSYLAFTWVFKPSYFEPEITGASNCTKKYSLFSRDHIIINFLLQSGFGPQGTTSLHRERPLEHLGRGKLRAACIHKGPGLNYMHMREGTSYGSNSGRGN